MYNVGDLIPIGGGVKSIQRITVAMGSDQERNITISSVDVNKSIVLVNGVLVSNVAASIDNIRARITSATNINLYRGSGASVASVAITIIEFNSIKSLQKGDTTVTASGNDVTVSTVNQSKVMLIYSFYVPLGADSSNKVLGEVINSTTLRFSINAGASYTSFVHYQLIEFN